MLNMSFTYNQVLGLVMQLPRVEKYNLYRELEKGLNMSFFKTINSRNQNLAESISDEEILAECKAARKEIYDASHS